MDTFKYKIAVLLLGVIVGGLIVGKTLNDYVISMHIKGHKLEQNNVG